MSKAGFMLKFMVHDLHISLDEIFYEALRAQREGNEKGVKELTREHEKTQEMIRMGMDMMEEGLDHWDWKWLAKGGHLSQMDWAWFGDTLKKEGISKEEFDKKRKVVERKVKEREAN